MLSRIQVRQVSAPSLLAEPQPAVNLMTSRSTLTPNVLIGREVRRTAGTQWTSQSAGWALRIGVKVEAKKFAAVDDVFKGYETGQCDKTADVAQLYAIRLRQEKPDDQTVLPDVILKEPLGAGGAAEGRRLVSAGKVHAICMINAEELGIDSKNIERAVNPEAGCHALRRHRGRIRRGTRPDQGLGGAHCPPRRQIRRGL
jgi:hypothetical protein